MRTDAEAGLVEKILSEMNRSRYGQAAQRPNHAGGNPRWCVTILDGAYDRFAHAATVWADHSGKIWIESARLGSSTSWVAEEYGEGGSDESTDVDYRTLTLTQVQDRMKRFPKVSERIEVYKQAARAVSGRMGVPVEMVCDGWPDVAWFQFRAQVDSNSPGGLEDKMRKAVAAMKEVYDRTEGARHRNLPEPVDVAETGRG